MSHSDIHESQGKGQPTGDHHHTNDLSTKLCVFLIQFVMCTIEEIVFVLHEQYVFKLARELKKP